MPGALLRQRFATTTLLAAEEAVRAVLGEGTVTAEPGPFTFDVLSAVDDGVSVTRIASVGADVRLRIDSSPELVVFAVREGAATLERDGMTASLAAGGLGLVPPGRGAQLQWNRVAIDAVSIGIASLVRILGSHGRPLRLGAARLEPRSPELAVLWGRVATVLAGTVLEAPDLYQRDLVRGQMIDALAATTIEAFELADEAEGGVDRDGAVLHRAERYMREHLGDPLAVTDVAQAAGVSLRGLQLIYQRRSDSTPLLHLRRLRLEAARAALLQPRREAVGVVARRVGYSNVGRFSAHYRELFGEHPSAT